MAQMSTQVSHVLDDPAELWLEHEVASNPTMIFISSDGSMERHSGGLGPQELLAKIKELS